MFSGAKSESENISNIFCKVETHKANDSDSDDRYDMETMSLSTKNIKRVFLLTI